MGMMNVPKIKLLEVIRIRSTSLNNDSAIKELIDGIDKQAGLIDIKLYIHTSTPGDFSINLNWQTDNHRIEKSELGINLSSRLKEFGMIDHAVWIEK